MADRMALQKRNFRRTRRVSVSDLPEVQNQPAQTVRRHSFSGALNRPNQVPTDHQFIQRMEARITTTNSGEYHF